MIITDVKKLKEQSHSTTIFEGQAIISQLEKALDESEVPGIGLAAIQIGVRKQVCIIRTEQKLDLINPEIVAEYDLREFHGEGCLSFPGEE